jgi:hypothetical protein
MLLVRVRRLAVTVREFFLPSYRPERHYMRGPGPACAKRGTMRHEAGAH